MLLAYESGAMTGDQAFELVRHFLSSLSWSEGRPVKDLEYLDGTSPVWIGKNRARMVAPQFRVDYLPAPADAKARLALSLYREALYVNSVPYRVLGFFKIVNILHPDGPKQIAWINTVIDKVAEQNPSVLKRIAALRAAGDDLGRYLYGSGRCAVAHAWSEPIADPDSPEDRRRLVQDLPVVRALAEWLIEHELGVKSRDTIWAEHLYELEGFRPLVGDALVNALKDGRAIDVATIPALPRLSLRVRGEPPMPAFEGLRAEAAGIEPGGRLVLRCGSDDGLVQALPVLNFAAERLEFPTEEQLFVGNDGTLKAVQNVLDAAALLRRLLLNGQFEIWNAETGVLLGRTDPYIATNIDLAGSIKQIDSWISELRETEQRLLAASAAGSTGVPPGGGPTS